jgi:hypothetical protein
MNILRDGDRRNWIGDLLDIAARLSGDTHLHDSDRARDARTLKRIAEGLGHRHDGGDR